MSRKWPWTNVENEKIVNELPIYRSALSSGKKITHASKSLAKELLEKDSANIFNKRREPLVKNEINTVAAHIRRMDKIAAGDIAGVLGDEPHWFSKLPR
ncbi:hypothetical protein [Paenibacillus alginolyticus]|uniref:Uncharacterized protein n=1 Tax=Paenibacillus alginolyticus TaxID=59839 RepID=A0ABT4GJP7_9BACL|nr:hypothetical protein [Paenibacillus alginolyticus]MCY9696424.1 hypothetical protein [Paenibacillus alginolyticus]MEC0145261.1 hypothetical protein [Paenibacillus alginolyticus]